MDGSEPTHGVLEAANECPLAGGLVGIAHSHMATLL